MDITVVYSQNHSRLSLIRSALIALNGSQSHYHYITDNQSGIDDLLYGEDPIDWELIPRANNHTRTQRDFTVHITERPFFDNFSHMKTRTSRQHIYTLCRIAALCCTSTAKDRPDHSMAA